MAYQPKYRQSCEDLETHTKHFIPLTLYPGNGWKRLHARSRRLGSGVAQRMGGKYPLSPSV
jgi:hypothetical protein